MDVQLNHAAVELDSRTFLALRGARGATVLCLSGELWITQDGDPRDYFASPGAPFEIDVAGTVLIQAQRPTRLLMLEPPPRAPGGTRRWIGTLLRSLGPRALDRAHRTAALRAV